GGNPLVVMKSCVGIKLRFVRGQARAAKAVSTCAATMPPVPGRLSCWPVFRAPYLRGINLASGPTTHPPTWYRVATFLERAGNMATKSHSFAAGSAPAGMLANVVGQAGARHARRAVRAKQQ